MRTNWETVTINEILKKLKELSFIHPHVLKTIYEILSNTREDILRNVSVVLHPYSGSQRGPVLVGYQYSFKYIG